MQGELTSAGSSDSLGNPSSSSQGSGPFIMSQSPSVKQSTSNAASGKEVKQSKVTKSTFEGSTQEELEGFLLDSKG
jgi:hypothetical protein